jgi:hypothetical protein
MTTSIDGRRVGRTPAAEVASALETLEEDLSALQLWAERAILGTRRDRQGSAGAVHGHAGGAVLFGGATMFRKNPRIGWPEAPS